LTYYLFGPKIDRKSPKVYRDQADARVEFNQKVYKSVSGAREFRAFGVEEWDIGRNRTMFQKVTDTVLLWVYYTHLRWGIRNLSFQFGTVAIFVAGYFLLTRTSLLTVGQFIAFLLV